VPTVYWLALRRRIFAHIGHRPYIYNATSRKVAGSIQDEDIGFFNLLIPSSYTMTLGSTQPLPETSTRNLPVE
jgi:hypothetical protein